MSQWWNYNVFFFSFWVSRPPFLSLRVSPGFSVPVSFSIPVFVSLALAGLSKLVEPEQGALPVAVRIAYSGLPD